MARVVSPTLAYMLHGGDDPYPVMSFTLNLVYTALLVAPLILPMRIGILHPLVFPLLFTTLKAFIKDPYYLLSPIHFVFSDYQEIPLHVALMHYSVPQLAAVYLKVRALNIVGLLAYYMGYAWFRVQIKRRVPRQYALVATPLFIIIAMTVFAAGLFIYFRGGLTAHITSLAFGRFQALGTLGYLLVPMDVASIAVFLWYAMRPGALRSPWFLAVLAPVALLPFFLTGSRSGIFLIVIEMGVLWLMHKRRLPAAAIAVVLLMVPVGLITLGVLLDVRTSAWSTGEARFDAVTAFDMKGSIERAQQEVQQRGTYDAEVGVVAEGHHTTGHQWGKTYVGALMFWLPRAIWPEKPRTAGTVYVNKIMLPGADFGVPTSPVAEAYWNFGYIGIVLIMGLWGCFHRWLADSYAINGDNPFFRVFYLLTLTNAAPASDAFPPYMQELGLLFFLFLVLRTFGGAQRARQSAPAGWRPAPTRARVPAQGRFGPP
jgi:hypothetical protein